MRTLLRIVCLLLFVGAGIGAAVYLAERAPASGARQAQKPASHDSQGVPEQAPALQYPATVRGERGAPHGAADSLAESAPEPNALLEPQMVPHHPRVARGIDPSHPHVPRLAPMADDRRQVDVDTLVDVIRELKPLLAQPSAIPHLAQLPAGPVLPAPAPDMNSLPTPQLAQPAAPGSVGPSAPQVIPSPVPSPVTIEQLPGPPPKPAEGDNSLEITFDNANLRDALKILSREANINILAAPTVEGTISVTLRDVSVYEALDAILKSTGYSWRRDGKFIYVGTPADFAVMQTSADKIGTRIYRPNYVTSAELQKLLTPLLTPSIGKISTSTPALMGIASDLTSAGGNNFAQGDSVIVQDYESVLDEIDQIVAELDKRPLQIAIEAMIVSVVLNDSNDVGVSWQVLRNEQYLRLGSGTPRVASLDGSGVPDGTGGVVGEYKFTTGGLQFAYLDSTLGMFINALETIGDVSIVARPQLLCLNKQKAEILIGEQIGYFTNVLTETSTTQTVEFLNVGTQLLIRPYISYDGQIRMEVHPEISTGSVSNLGVPSKTLTQVTTNVMCFDGCTVVIGGLMQEDLDTQTQQVPFLGSTPVIGPLFRTKTDKIRRRELLVLLTPRIVYDPEYSKESAIREYEYRARNDSAEQQMSPVGHLAVSNRYLSKAIDAYNEGNMRKARRWADLSVHFNASNREAVVLRNKLLGVGPNNYPPPGDGSMAAEGNFVGDGLEADALEGEALAPWVLDGLEAPPAEVTPIPQHPREPGIPGYRREIIRPGELDNAKP